MTASLSPAPAEAEERTKLSNAMIAIYFGHPPEWRSIAYEALKTADTRLAALLSENATLRVERDELSARLWWVGRQATRPGLTDAERLSIIANHPTIVAALAEATP